MGDAWKEHVLEYRSSHANCTLKEALVGASKTYGRKNQVRVVEKEEECKEKTRLHMQVQSMIEEEKKLSKALLSRREDVALVLNGYKIVILRLQEEVLPNLTCRSETQKGKMMRLSKQIQTLLDQVSKVYNARRNVLVTFKKGVKRVLSNALSFVRQNMLELSITMFAGITLKRLASNVDSARLASVFGLEKDWETSKKYGAGSLYSLLSDLGVILVMHPFCTLNENGNILPMLITMVWFLKEYFPDLFQWTMTSTLPKEKETKDVHFKVAHKKARERIQRLNPSTSSFLERLFWVIQSLLGSMTKGAVSFLVKKLFPWFLVLYLIFKAVGLSVCDTLATASTMSSKAIFDYWKESLGALASFKILALGYWHVGAVVALISAVAASYDKTAYREEGRALARRYKQASSSIEAVVSILMKPVVLTALGTMATYALHRYGMNGFELKEEGTVEENLASLINAQQSLLG